MSTAINYPCCGYALPQITCLSKPLVGFNNYFMSIWKAPLTGTCREKWSIVAQRIALIIPALILYPFIGLLALGGATCCKSCIPRSEVHTVKNTAAQMILDIFLEFLKKSKGAMGIGLITIVISISNIPRIRKEIDIYLNSVHHLPSESLDKLAATMSENHEWKKLAEDDSFSWTKILISMYSMSAVDTHIYFSASRRFISNYEKDQLHVFDHDFSLDETRGGTLRAWVDKQNLDIPPEKLAEMEERLKTMQNSTIPSPASF
jgi:hypothetical protein